MTGNDSTETTFRYPSDRDVEMTRVFDVPRRLVFEASTDPAHVPAWYGPRDYTLTLCEADLRVGGEWNYVLRGPDGSDFRIGGVYHEFEPYDRIVHTELYPDFSQDESLVTVTFSENDGVTTLVSTVRYPSAETRDVVVASGMEAGASESFERLAEYLRTLL